MHISVCLTVVIQAWDFRQGGNFVLDMQKAVQEAQRTLIVLSPDFLASKFTAPEWAAAFAQDPTGAQGRLLPVRVRECTPDGLLAQIVYIDLVGLKSRDEARIKLLAGVAQGRAKPASEPGMPALDPGSPGAPGVPARHGTAPAEPPWPPALELAADVAGSIFWRVARFAAIALIVAMAVLAFLRSTMPEYHANQPGAVYSQALIWGVAAALLVEALVRLWRRWRLSGRVS